MCKELGWETHPDVMKAVNDIRDLFDDYELPEEIAEAFEKQLLKVYGGVLKQHKRVVQMAFSRPEEIDGTFGSAVKWLTKEYIGEEMYMKVPVKYRHEWEGSQTTAKPRGQRTDRYGRRYDINQTEILEDASTSQSEDDCTHTDRRDNDLPDYVRTALRDAKVKK